MGRSLAELERAQRASRVGQMTDQLPPLATLFASPAVLGT